MMKLAPGVLISHAQPIHDPEQWKKAYGVSAGIHAVLLLFLIIFSVAKAPEIKTVLTEVKFIEAPKTKAVPTIPKDKSQGAQSKVDQPAVEPVYHRGSSGSAKRAKSNENLPPAPISAPKGSPEGKAVSRKPLSGPIISANSLGNVGKKRGSIIELAGRTDGPDRKGTLLPIGDGTEDRGKMITLEKSSMDEIRKREASVGAPLVARQVAEGAIGSKKLAALKKKTSDDSLKSNPLDKNKWGNTKGPFSMEGPLKYRKILKMDLPPYPRWAEEKGIEAAVSIRLWVNPKGRVLDNMYLERTSGYSELDHLAMDALKEFRFVTLPDDQPQEDEWGVATFRFELKK